MVNYYISWNLQLNITEMFMFSFLRTMEYIKRQHRLKMNIAGLEHKIGVRWLGRH